MKLTNAEMNFLHIIFSFIKPQPAYAFVISSETYDGCGWTCEGCCGSPTPCGGSCAGDCSGCCVLPLRVEEDVRGHVKIECLKNTNQRRRKSSKKVFW